MLLLLLLRGSRGRDRMVVGFILPVQSVPFTTNLVSSNPAQSSCARYSIK